jgi:hypothetical protein
MALYQMKSHGLQADTRPTEDARCECGHLVAKLRPDGVELKCKRCKRLILIPYAALEP